MEKKRIVIEVDEAIEPEFRLNLSNWIEDFNGEDLAEGKVKVLPEGE